MLPSEDKRKSACCGWEKVTINVPIQAVLVQNWLRVFGRVFCCFGPSQLRTILSRTMQQTFPPWSAAFSLFSTMHWDGTTKMEPTGCSNWFMSKSEQNRRPSQSNPQKCLSSQSKIRHKKMLSHEWQNLTRTVGWQTLRKGTNSLNHLKRTEGQITRAGLTLCHHCVVSSLPSLLQTFSTSSCRTSSAPSTCITHSCLETINMSINVQVRTKRMEKRRCLPRHLILPVQTVLDLRGWWQNWGWR